MSKSGKVFDFKAKRKESVEDKRRSFERMVFKNFMGTYSVLDEQGSCFPITLVDISQEGCMFQIPWDPNHSKHFQEESELTLRMYFTERSYLPVVVNIKHAAEYIDNTGTYVRYGCQFDQSISSIDALRSFIDFIDKFAEHSVLDRGDAKVYFL